MLASPPADDSQQQQEQDQEQQQLLALQSAECLYLQAINSCLAGDTAAADAALSQLGCCWRLSAGIWQQAAAAAAGETGRTTTTTSSSSSSSTRLSPVAVCDAALPPPLLAALQAAFSGGDVVGGDCTNSSSFWQQHAYGDPDTPFFSYLIDLGEAADKVAAAAAAAGGGVGAAGGVEQQQQAAAPHALELAAVLLQRQIMQLSLPPAAAAAARATHVEWWVHTRPPWSPHQLHLDAAEGAFRQGLGAFSLLHPSLSSVVYLTGAGGPTVVLEQDSRGATPAAAATAWQQGTVQADGGASAPAGAQEEPSCKRSRTEGQQQQQLLAQHGTCIQPLAGRFAVWPGNLLHGVLPGTQMPLDVQQEAEADAEAVADAGQRTTLILAWWQGDPRQLVTEHQEAAATAAKVRDGPGLAVEQPAAAATDHNQQQQQQQQQQLGPCMPMPQSPPAATLGSGSSNSNSSLTGWMQALQLPQQLLTQVMPLLQQQEAKGSEDAVGSGVLTHRQRQTSAVWRLLPSVAPAWEAVVMRQASTSDASGRCQQPQMQQQPCSVLLQRVPLPCLRFFLRSDWEITAAYVPASLAAAEECAVRQ